MSKIFNLLIASLICIQVAQAQIPTVQNVSSAGGDNFDDPKSVVVSPNGEVYIVGLFQNTVNLTATTGPITLTSQGGKDILILKYAMNGSLLSAVSIGSAADERVGKAALSPQNTLFITGSFANTIDLDPSPTGTAQHTPSLMGQFSPENDLFIAQYSTSLTYQSAMVFANASATSILQAFPMAVEFDAQGNLYCYGHFLGTFDFDNGPSTDLHTSSINHDYFVFKYNANMEFQWGLAAGGDDNYEFIYDILTYPNGDMLLLGSYSGTADLDPSPAVQIFSSVDGRSDIFMIKINSNGATQWIKTLEGSGQDIVNSAAFDAAGNFLIAGYYGLFSGSTFDADPDPTNVVSLIHNGGTDALIAKYNPDGNLIWAKSMNSPNAENYNKINIDAAGNIYLNGTFTWYADFDLDPNQLYQLFPARTTSDSFLAKYDPAGNLIYALNLGGTNADNALDAHLLGPDHIILTGSFIGTLDYTPTTSGARTQALTATSAGITDIYMLNVDTQAAPLPLTMLSFDGIYTNQKLHLNWLTTSEQHISHFEVQKSLNGLKFEAITKIEAIGNNQTEQNQYNYEALLQSDAYFRLKIVESNGQSSYSKMLFFRNPISTSPTIKLSPNPSSNSLFLENMSKDMPANYQIINTLGQVVKAGVLTKNTLTIANLPNGMYYLKLAVGKPLRFVKN
jgi:hypothetical protein